MENVIAADGCAENQRQIDYEKVLELALEIGVGILSCGGSVSRVETAVDRLCSAYGAEEVNVAAFPSMIIAGVREKDGRQHTYMKRVYSISTNLCLLEKYNQLSRDVCREKYDPDDALKMSYEIAHGKVRNKWLTILGAGSVAATYSVFFGGTIADCLPAFIVAFFMAWVNELLSSRSLNVYATTFILSVIGGLFSISLCKLLVIMGLQCHGSMVMIGTIMILIPGLMITNAVRDMFTGDLMSGTFQLLNGILIAVVIAAGYGVAMLLLNSIADFVPLAQRTGWQYYVYFITSGILGTAAVCLFFNLKVKRLGWALGTNLLAFGAYLGVNAAFGAAANGGLGMFITILSATLVAALTSEVLARLIKTPATVILVPAIIAFVPGSALYYTMEAIVGGNMPVAGQKGVLCLLTLLGLAVGICVAAIVFRLISPVKLKYYKKNKLALQRKSEKYEDKK